MIPALANAGTTAGTVTTTKTSTPATVLGIPTSDGDVGQATVVVSCRAITAPSGGSIGDSWGGVWTITYRNEAGAVSIMSDALVADGGDGSMSGTLLSFSVTGTTIEAQIANIASAIVTTNAAASVLTVSLGGF